MIFRESETVELREMVDDDIKKEEIDFSNRKGGTLYIGIRNNGEIACVKNPDEVILQIRNKVRDLIRPGFTVYSL